MAPRRRALPSSLTHTEAGIGPRGFVLGGWEAKSAKRRQRAIVSLGGMRLRNSPPAPRQGFDNLFLRMYFG
jgi:hypothetical protein